MEAADGLNFKHHHTFLMKEREKMLQFILGEAGSGKSSAIIEMIKERAESGKKIYVIVPEQFSFEYERKMYMSLGSAVSNSINVLSFTRLAGLIFDTIGNRSGEYADDNARTVLMYLAMKEIQKSKSMLYYARQAESRTFINDALDMVADLRRAAVTSESFSSRILSADEKIKDKAMDIAMIYSAWDRVLAERGFRDSLTDITEASALANMNDFFEGSICFIDEFDSFSPDELEMIDTIASSCSELVVSLCTPETEKKDYSLFVTVTKTFAKLVTIAEKYSLEYKTGILDKPLRFENAAVEKLSRNIFRRKSAPVSSEECIQITEAKDLYQEADFVCSYIRKLVSENKYRFGEISIASRQPEEYDMILKAALERYGIPYFSDTENSVMHTSIVILITSLLEIIGSKKTDSDAVFRYAKTFLTPLMPEQTAFLENFCYKWSIDGEMWETPFSETGLAASEKSDELERAEQYRKILAEPVFELREKCRNTSASAMCRNIYEFLEEQKITERVKSLITGYQENEMTDMASELTRLWGCIMDAFSTVSEILGDEKMKPDAFAELFTLIIKQNKFLSPPQKLDIVSVVSAEKARLSGQKVIFVMGANEGILPCASGQSGLLSDTDKEAFGNMGIDLGRDTRRVLADERFIVYRLFSAASERIMISYSLSDAQGGTRFPSYILPQISGMYSDNIRRRASDYDILFYSPTPASAYHNYVQNMFDSSEKSASLRAALLELPEYRHRIEYLDSVSPDGEHRIENTDLLARLMGMKLAVSATSFEEYTLCHFKYFCHHALHIAARDRKELNLMELGSIVHSCLENIFSGCSSKEEFINLPEERIIAEITEFSEKYRAENLGGDFGKNARLNAKFEKFTEDTLHLVNHLKQELSASKFIPEKFEFEIIESDGTSPVRIKRSDGTEIVLKGKIDRIDSYTDEETGEKFIRIIDYKTGVKKFSLENIIFGIDMQMLLYLFSITGSGGPFGDTIPAGVLYMPSGTVALNRDRDDDSDVSEYLSGFYHMNGVVLKELKVLRAMEESIEGVYIPAELTAEARKKGTFELKKSSSVLTRPQFERLRNHTYSLLEKMAEDFYGGSISAEPLNFDSSRDVCAYCDYREICGNFPRRRERPVPDNAEELLASVLGNDGKEEE